MTSEESAADVSRELARALAGVNGLHDWAALPASTSEGTGVILFAVPATSAIDHTRGAIERAVSELSPRPVVALVSRIPRTRLGVVDRAALGRLQASDGELAAAWEAALRKVPEVESVSVRLVERVDRTALIHVSDLIPGRSRRSADEEPAPATSGSGAPARAEGEPLPAGPVRLAEALAGAARGPHGVRFLELDGREQQMSYRQLEEEARRILGGLRASGLLPGDPVVFQLVKPADFIPVFWACALGGLVAVPVPVPATYAEASQALANLRGACELLSLPPIVTRRDRAGEVAAAAAAFGLKPGRVLEVEALREAPPAMPHDGSPDDLALMLLTSGSTGVPKLVQHTQRSILANAVAAAHRNGFHADDVSLNWFPLEHVGGLVMFHLRDVRVGCQQIQAPMEAVLRDPLTWLTWIHRYRATISWSPNFGYALVNRLAVDAPDGAFDLSCMRFLLNGGEAIVARQARQFLTTLARFGLPGTAMHPAWGMSETSSGVTYSHEFRLDTTSDDDPFVVVGRAVPGFAMRVVDESGAVAAEGVRGALEVRGPQVTLGYYKNPEAQREAFTADGWFRTGDLATIVDGRLTITGRHKDVIIINGLNYASHEVEAVVEEVPGVVASFTAAVAVRRGDDTTDRLAIFFHAATRDADAERRLISEIRARVARELGLVPTYVLPVARQDIPKTDIGKIQRARLRQALQRGDFDALIKRVDIEMENASTVPDWFYRAIWCRSERPSGEDLAGVTALVLHDSAGVGARLSEEIARAGGRAIQVRPGARFARVAADAFELAPGDAAGLAQLIEALRAGEIALDAVVHLAGWSAGRPAAAGELTPDQVEAAEPRGAAHLLALLQGLERAPRRGALRLLWVTSDAQVVRPTDAVDAAAAPALALLETAAQELGWLRPQALDLPADDADGALAALSVELAAPPRDRAIAYRDGHRLVLALERAALERQPVDPEPIRPGGVYLVAGGLGGIGVELARHILRARARVLLVGRQALPDRARWPDIIKQGGPEARRARDLQLLERMGDVLYVAADITDADALGAALALARGRFGRDVDGVFQLAGELAPGPLLAIGPEQLNRALRPKVRGTLNLYQATRGASGPFVLFSSVNGLFGGTGVGAYAAANRFLDAFAAAAAAAGDRRVLSLAWSMWKGTGMSEAYAADDLTRARGYATLSLTQGMVSLDVALHRARGALLVGLDGANQAIRRYVMDEAARELHDLEAQVSLRGAPVAALESAVVRDRFGRQTRCAVAHRRGAPAPAAPAPAAAPSSGIDLAEAESKLIGIWKDVLELADVETDQSFFDVGGHSLLVPSIQKRVEESFARSIAPVDVFRYPTIAAMARFLSTPAPSRALD